MHLESLLWIAVQGPLCTSTWCQNTAPRNQLPATHKMPQTRAPQDGRAALLQTPAWLTDSGSWSLLLPPPSNFCLAASGWGRGNRGPKDKVLFIVSLLHRSRYAVIAVTLFSLSQAKKMSHPTQEHLQVHKNKKTIFAQNTGQGLYIEINNNKTVFTFLNKKNQ